ncbi:ankyrin repeat domain-containing protein [Decorospora gaudefroyi]|uniref:Ankyrin repeat domain-containing protein n=1 Tax=Decorospora gaudefroyi TaxID=184978 RepID=A0A6A5KMZ8_9PLEO|nr:ankyrin repeat domain-containing protein [Decorospora gaudefroyi]
MLDEKHEDAIREVGDNDENVYCMGSVAGHNVVIVCLPAGHIGNNPAAAVATQMRAAFKGIRFGLMVGIGGGVPSAEADIRLGDVVVSQPQWTFGGVVQYDFGRTTPNGLERIGSLNSPPQILLSAVSTVQANAIVSESTLSDHLSTLERIPTFQRCRAGPDLLFKAAYNHEHGTTCDQCSAESRQPRPERESGVEVAVHYGTIASGNQVMKDAAERDRWQAYAAGTAAAYAKELLSVIPAAEVMNTRRAEDAMNGASSQSSERYLQSPSPDRAPHKRKRIENLSSSESGFREWLLKSEQYLNWLDTIKVGEHHGFLWIKGKAGTGKSTLMKFALLNARKTMKDRIVLSFFFNARGEDIEKSTIGTYRSLLLQLLERLPALQSVFDSLSLSTSKFTTDHEWNAESLKTLLEQAIRALGDSSVVRDMIQFFEHIGDLAVSNGIRFQVCFSSRHYPYITIRNGLELVLEGQEGHSQDITEYVETELKIGKSKIAQQIRAELQGKASGIFMWVVLVVGILNKESDRGKILTLRQKLQEIPADLHELFRDILTRDSHDKDELVLCIQWVLFAKQPLSPEQLYHAIYAGADPGVVTEWDPEEITKDVVKRFILSSSKGLAEVTVSKEPKAQFIHESVRDFLLKDNGLGKIWPEFGSNFQGQSHERLKQCCFNYISVDGATPLKIPDDLPKASSQQAASLRKSVTQTFPFLEYTVHNVLYHADAAEGGGIPQADFLDSFPLPRWVKLDNLFEKHEVRRHTERGRTPLYVTAEKGASAITRTLLDKGADVNAQGGRYGNALQAALAGGHKEIAMLLLDKDADDADVNAQGGHYGNALQAASSGGHEAVVKLLLDKDADVNAQGGLYGNALQAALAGGHKEIATLLQTKGAFVRYKGC